MPRLALILFAALASQLPCPSQGLRDPLIGTVTAPDGKPIAGAKVQVWRAGGRGTGMLDLDYKHDFRRVALTATDRRGRFAMQLPVGLPCRLIVDHAPHAIYLREDCLPGDSLTIQLCEPAIVGGTLKLATGKPATGSLRAWNRDTHDEVFRGRTDEQGRYRFDRVAPGPVRIEIAPDHAPAPAWKEVELVADRTHTFHYGLAAGTVLKGRVIDAATGQPIAGARIGEGWTMFRAVTSGPDGRFEMRGYGSEGYDSVHCKAEGYVKQVVPRAAAAAPELEFELTRGVGAKGRIVDADGEPMADVYVQAFGSVHEGNQQFHNCIGMRTDADGRFECRGLRDNLNQVLVVRQDGYAMLVYSLPKADDDDVIQAGEITLPKTRIVRGLLRDAKGWPIANTKVSIWGYNADRERLVGGTGTGNYGLLDMYVGRRKGRTNDAGQFAFGDIPAGEFHLVAYDARGNKIAIGETFTVKADQDPPQISLTAN